MIRKADAIHYEAAGARGDEGEADIVAGHLASRRVERRVIMICSIVAVLGLVLLGGAMGGTARRAHPAITPAAPAGR